MNKGANPKMALSDEFPVTDELYATDWHDHSAMNDWQDDHDAAGRGYFPGFLAYPGVRNFSPSLYTSYFPSYPSYYPYSHYPPNVNSIYYGDKFGIRNDDYEPVEARHFFDLSHQSQSGIWEKMNNQGGIFKGAFGSKQQQLGPRGNLYPGFVG